MLISLQLLGTPQGPADREPVRSFEDEQVTIGRAPNCHVVLPDSLRIISRQHARLGAQDGQVLLTCLSASAPVRVNDVAVAHGGMFALSNGDVLHIGGFALRFTSVAAAPGTASRRASPAPGTTPEAAAPWAQPASEADPERALSPRPWRPSPQSPSPPLPPPPAPQPQPSPQHRQQPLSLPMSLPMSPPMSPPSAPAASAQADVRPRARLDEWFDLGPAAVPSAMPLVAPASTSTSAHPSQSASASASAPASAAAGLPAPRDATPSLPQHPGWAPTAEVDLDLRSGAYAPSPADVGPAPAAGLAAAKVGSNGPAASAASVASHAAPAASAPAAPGRAAPAPRPAAAAAASQPGAPADDARAALMQAFLEGAGLGGRPGATSTQMLPPMALTPAWMRHLGELLRASVEGALALLHSRSTVKREMRAEVTVIARRQNNPLKFAPDAPAALAHLVAARRSPGFLEPVAALKDAHEDLLVHHLAVVAGMRAAMFELISRLGPEDVLREEGAAKGLSFTLPSLHEAALWRRYRQRHADMIARLDDDFEAVFGREFTKAYEAQARRVREQAPPEDTAP